MLASAASVTALISDIQSGLNDVQSGLNNVQSIANDVKSAATQIATDFKNLLPTITIVPSNIDSYFSSVENKLTAIPQSDWNSIKSGVYPPDVSSWIHGLPTSLQGVASSKLNEWATDLGTATVGATAPTSTPTSTKSTSTTGSGSNRRTVAFGALGVAGVLAVAIVL